MEKLKAFSHSIYAWLLVVAGIIALGAEFLRRLGQVGALENEAWFIHAVSDTVTQLAQRKARVTMGAVRVKDGVVGKTCPFNRIGSQDMQQITTRDANTEYANPPQSKRRAVLLDFGLAVLIDEFDEIKTLTNPMSEHAQIMGYGLARKQDDLLLSVVGLDSGGSAQASVGGILGLATTVDEAGETSSTTALPSAQFIANGGTNLTFAKINTAREKFDAADVEDEDRYFYYSPQGMSKLLTDTTVTSSDFNTIKAIASGGFPMDQSWMSFKWRRFTNLPKTGNIRSCIAVQRLGVGYASGMVKGVEVSKAPHKWNNTQAIVKLSAGAVRIDDARVLQIDIDETA